MDPARIGALLEPFLRDNSTINSESARPAPAPVLTPGQLQSISTYIDLLLHWNARINLTSIRQPEDIVTRHFGESLFAARQLFPLSGGEHRPRPASSSPEVIDVGSGAGFPGLPIKLWAPGIHLTLIESNHKKAVFLREVVRALTLTDVDILAARSDTVRRAADVVTLRAVERFASSLPSAATLVRPGGRMAILIGETQIPRAHSLVKGFQWTTPFHLPQSSNRSLIIGHKESNQ
ncbi:MAG: 16S rRNA (guanine(527)-N(7))-methyltransferase RsmG [Terriglobales bacterium]